MEPLLSNVIEHEIDGMRFFASRMYAKDVVTIEGSIIGGYGMVPNEKNMSQRILVDLLDTGTKTKSKELLRSSLALRGATISFSSGTNRTYFSASCLPEDIAFVCGIIVECLTESVLLKSEMDRSKAYVLAKLEKAKTDTKSIANREMDRLIFDPKQVNYSVSLPESIEKVKCIKRNDVIEMYRMLGTSGLVFTIVGDIQPEKALTVAERAFTKLHHNVLSIPSFSRNMKKPLAQISHITVADKATIDTLFAVSVPLTENDPLFLAFSMLVGMLGGGGLASGHLMRTIRERDGLTYGIYASPYGFNSGTDGALSISTTFSPNTFDRAVELTRKEVRNFFSEGITEEALCFRQEKNTGNYLLGLGTSHGVAGWLHYVGSKNKPLSYIDEYPSLVRAVTLAQMREVADLVNIDAMSLAAAGTFAKKSK